VFYVQSVPLGERPLPLEPLQRLAEVAGLYQAIVEDRKEPLQVPELPGEEPAGEFLDLPLLDAVRRNGRGRRKYTRTIKERLHG
jgi:hypothetical protein